MYNYQSFNVMAIFVCTSADVVVKEGKNPYVAVHFEEKGDNIFAQNQGQKLNMVLSGGFLDNTTNKPDAAKNLAWANENAPKMVGQETRIDGFDVPCEPIIRKRRDGSIITDESGKAQVFNTVTIYQFSKLDPESGELIPIGGWERLKSNARNLIKSSARIVAVAEIERQKAAKKAAEEAKKVSGGNPLSNDDVLGNASLIDLP